MGPNILVVQPQYNRVSTGNIVWGKCGVNLQDRLAKATKQSSQCPDLLYDTNVVNDLFEYLGWKTPSSQR